MELELATGRLGLSADVHVRSRLLPMQASLKKARE